MSLEVHIHTIKVERPTTPPTAVLSVDKHGAIGVWVDDIGDPEVEAVAAARAVLEYFLSLHDNVKAS